jgi:hypothetical protein
MMREEVRETGNDLLVNTLPFVSPTLQGMLPTAAQFYFPAGSSLPCSVAIINAILMYICSKKHSKLYKNVKTKFNFFLVLDNNDLNAHAIFPNRCE